MTTLRRGARGLVVGDVAVAVGLGVLAALVRRDLPTNGLIYDDAWVAAGAGHAGFDDILTISTNHPGFSLLLMTWSRLVWNASVAFVVPALVAGVLAAPVAYLALTRLRVHRAAALSATALLVVAHIHAVYSARVKPYTGETLIGLVAMVATPIVAGRRWRWRTAAVWTAAALAVGTYSAFATVIAGTATLVAAAHPRGDRTRRLAALAVQGPIQLAQLLLLSRRYDSATVAEDWGRYGGYFEFDEPLTFPRQVITHLRRFGQTVLTVDSIPALALVVVALVGLAWTAWRGDRRRAIAARLLIVQLAVAFVGALARQIPFGPAPSNPLFPAGRAMLWLLPALVGGVALGADMVIRSVDSRWGRPWHRVAAAIGLVATLAVTASNVTVPQSYDMGARTAAEFTERHLREGDVLVVLPNATWSYAAEPSADAGIRSDPTTLQGFVPTFTRPGTFSTREWDGRTETLGPQVAAADRIVIVNGWVGLGEGRVRELETSLTEMGFAPDAEHRDQTFVVTVWQRPG